MVHFWSSLQFASALARLSSWKYCFGDCPRLLDRPRLKLWRWMSERPQIISPRLKSFTDLWIRLEKPVQVNSTSLVCGDLCSLQTPLRGSTRLFRMFWWLSTTILRLKLRRWMSERLLLQTFSSISKLFFRKQTAQLIIIIALICGDQVCSLLSAHCSKTANFPRHGQII